MSDKVVLDEKDLEDVQGGTMRFSSGDMIMSYTHNDGSITFYPITNGDALAAYRRSLELHGQYVLDQEDLILDILQKEGIVGQQLDI